MDFLNNRRIMVWTFMGNSRMFEALSKYGDRINTVGLFSFKVRATGEIYESGVEISTMLPYIHKWPHIDWLLTISNDGTSSIFTALRNNTGGAQDRFLSEIVRIMEKYPWCNGVDIDLEKGGDYSTATASTAMFRNIYNAVKAYNPAKLVNICLPGMTGVNGSVGGENWCVYGDLNDCCDTASIMSYGMAWAGSAPGPVSPRSWLEGIYDYVVQVMSPEKVYFGMPAYGWNWYIHDTPQNLGRTYRGVSNTYYAAKLWMTGGYNFTGDGPPQPMIPIVAYWDDVNKVPWALPHVYDYMEGQDTAMYYPPLMAETYNGRRYLTAYGKAQHTEAVGVILDHGAEPDSYSGSVTISDDVITLGEEGTATYKFTVGSDGAYDVVVKEDYFSLTAYEENLAETEAGKRLMRLTKKDMISTIGQCFGILMAYYDIRQQYDYLQATFDILRDQNTSLLDTIKEIDKLYASADAEGWDSFSDIEKRFDKLLDTLPDDIWII